MGLTLLALAVAAVAVVMTISARRVMAARAEAARVRAMFSHYVAPHVVDEILARNDNRIFSGRTGYATILVCRIWNFALFAEQLTPDELLRYLNEFYTLAGKSIHKHRGMIDKFLGDGMIGAFGVPLEDPLQEEHAIRAAIDIVRLLDAMNARWTAEGRKALRCGIGISSGMVIAGDTGFLQRREYAVIGTEALVAARLQEHTETMQVYILVSDSTLEPVKATFATTQVQTLPMRGMRRNVRASVIRGLAREGGRDRLLLPPVEQFRQTAIEEEAPAIPEPTEPYVAAAPPPKPPPRKKPAPRQAPRAEPAPPPASKPRGLFDDGITIPETQRGGFGQVDDVSPEYPLIEAPAHYEDDSGRPPLRLGP